MNQNVKRFVLFLGGLAGVSLIFSGIFDLVPIASKSTKCLKYQVEMICHKECEKRVYPFPIDRRCTYYHNRDDAYVKDCEPLAICVRFQELCYENKTCEKWSNEPEND